MAGETIVSAMTCSQCRATVYSRARHDFRKCPCGDFFVDGGLDYTRAGAMHSPLATFRLRVEATPKELFSDWADGTDRFGLIEGGTPINIVKED